MAFSNILRLSSFDKAFQTTDQTKLLKSKQHYQR